MGGRTTSRRLLLRKVHNSVAAAHGHGCVSDHDALDRRRPYAGDQFGANSAFLSFVGTGEASVGTEHIEGAIFHMSLDAIPTLTVTEGNVLRRAFPIRGRSARNDLSKRKHVMVRAGENFVAGLNDQIVLLMREP